MQTPTPRLLPRLLTLAALLAPAALALSSWLLWRAPAALRAAAGARPRRVLASYSSGKPRFAALQRENCRSARALGIDECMLFTEDSIDGEWRARNADKLREPLGAGLWAWKAVAIFQALMRVADGDVVLYMDADSVVVADPAPLFELAAREDVVLFSECQWRLGQWATRTSLMLTGGEAFRDRYMIVASYSLWKKGPRALQFLAEWLTYLQDLRIVGGGHVAGFSAPEFPEFREHRHDMVPLCVSGYRWNLSFHRSPTQWGTKFCMGNYSNSPYGEIFYDGYVV